MAAKAVLNVIAPLREMESESESEEGPSESDEEEESSDESKHKNLLKAIDTLADKSKKRHKVGQRSEPNVKVSEFNLSSSTDQDERIALEDLVGALQNNTGYGSLKKKLDSMHKKSAVLDVPLPKPAAEKVQRTVAFEETAKDITKWAPTVKKNREAEHLSFPLNPYAPPRNNTRTLAANFKPRTPLEEEIMAVLQGSSHLMERKNKELTEEEEQALLAMDLQEAKDRRHELQKLRALQSYYEAKCRRAKKIKSKKYHREKRKAEKRSAQKLQDDPEKAKEELEKAERVRAEERVSLKHRNTSKWAKNLMLKGNKNTEARKALQEQLRISRNLTEKKTESDSEEQEEEELQDREEVEEGNTPSTFGTLVTDQDNPWSIETKTNTASSINSGGDSGLSSKFRRLEPVKGEEVKVSSDESGAEDEEKSEDEFELQLAEKAEVPKKKKKMSVSSEGKKKKSEKKKGKKVVANEGRGKDGKMAKKKSSSVPSHVSDNIKKEKRKRKSLQRKNTETNGKKGKKSLTNEEFESDEELSADETLGDDEKEDRRDSGSENQPEEILQTEEKTEKDGIWKEVKEKPKDNVEVRVDPKKIFRLEDDGSNTQILEAAEDNEHRLNIQQAFANDDVIEEFAREKAETEEAAKPKDLDLTLPGWGDWAGAGLKPSEKKTKKLVIPAAPAPDRKDKHLAHVIINENEDKRFAKNQVSTLPYPYTSQVQFERSIRNPVGKHWNTSSTVKELTTPRVTTLVGTIIDPIKATKDIKRKKSEEGARENKKKKQKKPAGSSVTIYN